jgi:hypothetical protein
LTHPRLRCRLSLELAQRDDDDRSREIIRDALDFFARALAR